MSTKKIVKLTDAVITQYLTGPDAAGQLRRCILCRGEFEEGERWLKMTRLGNTAWALTRLAWLARAARWTA